MKQILGHWLSIAIVLQFGVLAGFAQTGQYLFTGSEMTITLNPGTYDITAYGAQGGFTTTLPGLSGGGGGLGAEMAGEFSFPATMNLTLLVGGVGAAGGHNVTYYWGAGGGGGSFVVEGSTPLLIAGGGGGGGSYDNGNPGLTGTSGGNDTRGGGTGGTNGHGGSNGGGGGFYGGGTGGSSSGSSFAAGGAGGAGGVGSNSGGYGGGGGGSGAGGYAGGGGGGYSGGSGAGFGGGGGGGGSIIDASAIMVRAEVSGIASPDGSPNGEIIITEAPEPTTFGLVGFGVLSLLLVPRKAPSRRVDVHMVYED